MTRPRKKPRWGRRIGVFLLVILLAMGGLVFWIDSQLTREEALVDYPGRPEAAEGTNWLIVGSDSREGLDEGQQADLATGQAAGRRTDTIMLLHIPDNDVAPTLLSLPRDSFLPIEGYEPNRINAAFSFGGPQLLTRTVETATGLRIDHYAEVGFDGFAGIVESVGGVEMCLDEPINDPLAGIDLQAGCQELDGAQALGYVRTRASALGDLDRVERQREFLSALMQKATSAGVLANPFNSIPLALDTAELAIVNEDDHIWNLGGLAFAMRAFVGGEGVTTTVPFGGFGDERGMSVVYWDEAKSQELFSALAEDRPVPPELIVTE
ncbi:LCP family protein [Actinoalloteichus hymeniacidonis]|uniref:Transcriptional attenuator, LytR family n=1 Tax=Actinoalloteichus hymeniacidonis TaxID=340345 RepID=A0AAC9HUN1_9PSEU|nr:LCP family protein [Actinoalloteichus hymeniacidonis]AOS65914.1 transcriptional attenuator, LytR family [Actinoalloteichus hymeniacidonis]MBB5905990.1 LCP family protein required for cell wall assembly [Actinoalloteichus hymeniacidonis]